MFAQTVVHTGYPGWLAVMLVALLVLVFAHRHFHGISIGGLVALVIAGVVFARYWHESEPVPARPAYDHSHAVLASDRLGDGVELVSSGNIPVSEDAEQELQGPDWVVHPPKPSLTDGTLRRVISTAPGNEQEVRAQLQEQLRQLAREYVDSEFAQNTGQELQLSDQFLTDFLVDETFVQSFDREVAGEPVTVYQGHALVKIDPRARRELEYLWRNSVVHQRMWYTGGAAAFLLAVIGTIFGTLKLDTYTRGYYSRRLIFAAGAVILGLGFGFVKLVQTGIS